MTRTLYLLTIILFISCSPTAKNIDMNRDKLEFKAPINDVKDSLRVMNALLTKILSTKEYSYDYMVKKDQLIIDYRDIGKLNELQNSSKNDTISEFKLLTKEEIRRFLNLVIFLKNNYLTRGYMVLSDNDMYGYEYKYFQRGGFFENDGQYVRFVSLIQSAQDTLQPYLKSRYIRKELNSSIQQYIICDAKDSLVLYRDLKQIPFIYDTLK